MWLHIRSGVLLSHCKSLEYNKYYPLRNKYFYISKCTSLVHSDPLQSSGKLCFLMHEGVCITTHHTAHLNQPYSSFALNAEDMHTSTTLHFLRVQCWYAVRSHCLNINPSFDVWNFTFKSEGLIFDCKLLYGQSSHSVLFCLWHGVGSSSFWWIH